MNYAKELIKTILTYHPPISAEEVRVKLACNGIDLKLDTVHKYLRDTEGSKSELRYTMENRMAAPETKIIDGAMSKERTKCKEWKSLDDFHRRNTQNSTLGRLPRCKVCTIEDKNEYKQRKKNDELEVVEYKSVFIPTNQPKLNYGINCVY